MRDKELILKVIRGELLWNELSSIGVKINFDDDNNNCSIQSKTKIIVTPTIKDIVQGILRLYKMPNVIKKWATIVLGGSDFIDLKRLEGLENEDEIIDILWDLAGGNELNTEQITLLKSF